MPVPSGIKELVKFVDMKTVKENDVFKIKSEFLEAEQAQAQWPMLKFPKFLNGLVEQQDGTTAILCMAKPSYFNISEKLGRDTASWIDKIIIYKGKQKVGKAPLPAHIFEAAN